MEVHWKGNESMPLKNSTTIKELVQQKNKLKFLINIRESPLIYPIYYT